MLPFAVCLFYRLCCWGPGAKPLVGRGALNRGWPGGPGGRVPRAAVGPVPHRALFFRKKDFWKSYRRLAGVLVTPGFGETYANENARNRQLLQNNSEIRQRFPMSRLRCSFLTVAPHDLYLERVPLIGSRDRLHGRGAGYRRSKARRISADAAQFLSCSLVFERTLARPLRSRSGLSSGCARRRGGREK